MSILGEPGDRDELHRLQSNEIYLPRKDTREAVKTLGRGALACPSCDVPVVTAEPIGITARAAMPLLPRAPPGPQLPAAGPLRHAAQRRARDGPHGPAAALAAPAEPTHLVAWPTVQGSAEITLAEAARQAGVSPDTLRRWGEAGVIPDYRGRWTRAAAAHAQIVARLREQGHSLEEIKEAGEDGRLAFGYVDELFPPAAGRTPSSRWRPRPASRRR